VPGIVARVGVASPTQTPWINTNGWRFRRGGSGRFRYELPASAAAVAAAEAAAYDADAVLAIEASDLPAVGRVLSVSTQLPEMRLPDIADFGLVDDGSPAVAEVMNLFVRRNLLFQAVPAPSPRFPFTVVLGTPEYPRADAADPSAFALKVRRQLTDDRRSLRIYGSDVVVGRLTGDATRVRLYLVNYADREIGGLRVRVRGRYPVGVAHVAGLGRVALQEHIVVDGATEFSLASMTTYAVVDLSEVAR
jgi:hypothetical protein